MGGLLCTLHKRIREKWDFSVICLWKMKIMKMPETSGAKRIGSTSGGAVSPNGLTEGVSFRLCWSFQIMELLVED